MRKGIMANIRGPNNLYPCRLRPFVRSSKDSSLVTASQRCQSVEGRDIVIESHSDLLTSDFENSYSP